MKRSVWGIVGLWVAGTIFAAGCSGGGNAPAVKPGANTRTPVEAGTSGMAHDGDEHQPGPALSDEDKALAAIQRICPVSDEELGTMGSPIKLTVKGEAVFICCKACEKQVNADPDKIVAKVAELKKADQ